MERTLHGVPNEPFPVAATSVREGNQPSTPAILVVDDEFIVAHMVATMLRLSHYEVGRANDGIIALKRLRERSYHVILSDIKMPGLDGIGLYRAVQEQYPHLGQRFIFMTGATLGSEPIALLEQFGTPCIRKPFVLAELLALIRQVLTRQ